MRNLAIATATAIVLSTGAVMANEVLDQILAQDIYVGATITETRVNMFGIKVEATLADGTVVENRYRPDGTLRKSESTKDGVQTETRYDRNGTPTSNDSSAESDNGDDNQAPGSDDDSHDHETESSSHDSSSDHESSDHESDSGSDD